MSECLEKTTHKGVKIARFGWPEKDYQYGDLESLGDWEWKEMPLGTIHFIYWYSCGSYEGSGEALILLGDGTVLLHNLGHCSCYGPMERVSDASKYESLSALEASLSDDYRVELIDLLNYAKSITAQSAKE